MKCHFCSRPILGSDLARRVEVRFVWTEPEFGDELAYGDVPDAAGRLPDATGILARVYHHKCWLANKRRLQLQAAKDADPSAQLRQVADWREPVSAEVEGIRPREGDRDHRGA